MKSDIQKWLIGIVTSILIGLVMWWLTHSFLARPELLVADSRVSGCEPIVTEVTVFNSGDKIAEDCYLRVELYIDDEGLFPANYNDLKRLKRLDVASSDRFFVAPQKQQQVSTSYWSPKGSRCDLQAVYEDYIDLGLWLGIVVECEQASTTALARQGAHIYLPPKAPIAQ